MKQLLYALMAFCAFGLLSCRKSNDNFTIKQFDEDQIQQYIKNNGLSAVMKRDTSGGDTTGIYYQVLEPGPTPGVAIKYSDLVSYVYTDRTFDGKFSTTDTILNHTNTYGGYITPNGVQLAIKNIAKKFGAKIRVLIPSRLMYGINGTTISAYNSAGTVTYSNIAGNQCFDYTITIVADQNAYDDLSITKYMAANGLTGQYTKLPSGVWYRVTQVGTGTDPVSISSTLGVQYTGTLFNGIIFDQANNSDGTAAATFTLYDVIEAWQQVFPKVTAGAKLSLITPSRYAYGVSAKQGSTFTIPAFSCLRFDVNLISVSN